jgi:hypothetical protein
VTAVYRRYAKKNGVPEQHLHDHHILEVPSHRETCISSRI